MSLTPYSGQWPADGEVLAKQLIPDKGLRAQVQCGRIQDWEGVCSATWRGPNGSECEAQFTFLASGSQLINAYRGTLSSCTTERIR
jgi:hypothetical protein